MLIKLLERDKLQEILRDVSIAVSQKRRALELNVIDRIHNEYSDIDIAVISDDFGDMKLLERLEFIGGAMATAKIMDPVEVHAYTKEEFETKKEGTFVGDEIKAKGVEVG